MLTDTEARLRDAPSKRVLIEVAVLRAIEARQSITVDEVLKHLHRLRADESGEAPASPTPLPSSPPAAQPAPAPSTAAATKAGPRKTAKTTAERNESPAAPEAGTATAAPVSKTPIATGLVPADRLASIWADLMDTIGRASPFSRSYLLEAHPVSIENAVLTIGFDPETADHIELVNNEKVRTVIQRRLDELGIPGSRVRFVKAEGGRPRPVAAPEPATPAPASAPPQPPAAPPAGKAARPTPVPFNVQDFKNDPLIQKALEVFKGQIVEVRS
jgi:hypothetical protein